VPLRECARLLSAARVPATVQAIRRWCVGVTPDRATPRVRGDDHPRGGFLGRPPDGGTGGRPGRRPPAGRARAWLALEGSDAERILAILEHEMPRPARPAGGRTDAGCRMVVIPRGPGLPLLRSHDSLVKQYALPYRVVPRRLRPDGSMHRLARGEEASRLDLRVPLGAAPIRHWPILAMMVGVL
jgi:hypothetical protein